ncbi:MAG: hypothetical protein GY810_31325 [Aureispira sp.]|nr:hypothetical protein [Aureispira sp.]
MKNIKLIGILATTLILSMSLTTFAQGRKLKQKHIDEYGTKVFNYEMNKVFPIILEVLKNNNFEIELERKEKGLIKTRRKVISTTGIGTSSNTAQFTSNYRQYIVTIDESNQNETKVILKPRIFIGEADLTDRAVWVINGPAGEIKIWERLFNEIDERL